MASASLGSAYVLSDLAADQLIELERAGSAPVSTPGFISRRIDVPADRNARLLDLQSRLGTKVRNKP